MKDLINRYRKSSVFALVLGLGIVVMVIGLPGEIIAQSSPPGLPGSPEQTPIDGGLGILAALGGTYAIKKLREKKDV